MSKPRQKFLHVFFQTLLVLRGKATFANLSRFSGWSEKSFRRNYQKAWDFVRMNLNIIDSVEMDETIAAIDASAFKKAGSKTFGVGWFWSGSANQAIRGLEISCIALISLKYRTAFSLSVRQTDGKVKGNSRICEYIRQLKECKDVLRRRVKYIVADGFYSKYNFVEAVVSIGLHQIGRLRDDANMYYLFKGNHTKRKGRKCLYSGKFTGLDRRRWEYISTIEYDKRVLDVYTAILYHKSLKRIIRVVMLHNPDTGKHTLLFSTDTNLDAEKILDYYSARFQIEFLFRDAKQHLGLEECQSRNKKALDFHFNAVMASLNQIKADLYYEGKLSIDIPISIADYKTRETNRFLIHRIIEMLGISPDIVLNHPAYNELINFGRMAA
jgi:IS4 transposase